MDSLERVSALSASPSPILNNTNTEKQTYVVRSKSFRPDIRKPRQVENAVRDMYSAIYGEVNVSVEKCVEIVEIKGDYVEK